MLIRFRILLLSVTLALSSACLDLDWSFDEVARVTNPTGKFDAVLVETNGGATTSFGYEVFVVTKGGRVKRGAEAAFLYAAARNGHAYGVNLKWDGSHSLVIEYLEAQSANLKLQKVIIRNEEVLLSLRSGITDSNAPPGGMLYNLEKANRP